MRIQDRKFCIFVDTLTHLRSAEIILKEKEITDYFFLSTSDQIIKKLPSKKAIKINSLLSIFTTVFFKKEIKQSTIFLAARVDSPIFQLIFFLGRFKDLVTFDEGLFTIQDNSRYNSSILKPIFFNRSFYWASKFFTFPKNPSYFYRRTLRHFSFFEISNFRHTALSESKIEVIPQKKELKEMKNIFIGQPWQSMFLSREALERLKKGIHKLEIDLYISHPREDLSILADYLNTDIIQIKCISPGEDFIEKLNSLGLFNIFVVASTLVMGVNQNNMFNIIEISGAGDELLNSQDALKNALSAKKISFKVIKI